MKIGRSVLKRIIQEEAHKIYENRAMPDIAKAIQEGQDTMDLVEIMNEIGALVAQNHYPLTLKYDMGSMDLAGDVITQFERELMSYMDDYFGKDADVGEKVGTASKWLDEAIREEMEIQNVY